MMRSDSAISSIAIAISRYSIQNLRIHKDQHRVLYTAVQNLFTLPFAHPERIRLILDEPRRAGCTKIRFKN